MKSLYTIADEINGAATGYRMGQFQEIRRPIHGLSRPKTRHIFTSQTTHDEWAFHSGGRKEIQFNIGFEGDDNEYLRYGLAFSLEPSHTLPDPLTLKPRVLKLGNYIRTNGSELDDLRFCLNRHNGAVNIVFMDYHVEKVGLKRLWTLKWSRDFNKVNPWTRAGGVTAGDWSSYGTGWMGRLKGN